MTTALANADVMETIVHCSDGKPHAVRALVATSNRHGSLISTRAVQCTLISTLRERKRHISITARGHQHDFIIESDAPVAWAMDEVKRLIVKEAS